jgi:deoxyribonuclease V
MGVLFSASEGGWVGRKTFMVVISLSSRYNQVVKVNSLHSWQVSTAEALDTQLRLASQVSRSSEVASPKFIAGLDISVNRAQGTATGAAVVLSYPQLRLVESKVVSGKVDFPYVPGLLSFREAPLTLTVCEQLSFTPDLILVDGQGIAHPRRLGLASHLGLFLDTPTIGCAKSRLCGSYQVPAPEAGSYAELVDRGETIGAALRTKLGTNPIYVSIGHKVDLETAIYWVLQCCRGYRLPEPTRLAHLAAGGNLKPEKYTVPAADYQGRLL